DEGILISRVTGVQTCTFPSSPLGQPPSRSPSPARPLERRVGPQLHRLEHDDTSPICCHSHDHLSPKMLPRRQTRAVIVTGTKGRSEERRSCEWACAGWRTDES